MAKDNPMSFTFGDTMDEDNIDILTKLITDPETPETLKISILQKFIENTKDKPFFDTMLEYDLDLGECPRCGHENNFLIPEEELNKRGVVTAERDPRVKVYTTADDCPKYREACSKKRVSF
jgi:hypothetical protein